MIRSGISSGTSPNSGDGCCRRHPGQNVYITGVSGNFTTMKLNPAGSNIWSQTWTYGSPNISQAMIADLSSNVYVAGGESVPNSTYSRVIALKYDANGNQLWESDVVAGANGPQVVGVGNDSAGAMYVECNFAHWILRMNRDTLPVKSTLIQIWPGKPMTRLVSIPAVHRL